MLHGLPDLIFADRGTQFTSGFSRSLCKLVGITQNLSTAFHPETDSQTERVNGVLEQYLHGYINYQQDNWVEILTMAEFVYNKTISATTGITPLFCSLWPAPPVHNQGKPRYRYRYPDPDSGSSTRMGWLTR